MDWYVLILIELNSTFAGFWLILMNALNAQIVKYALVKSAVCMQNHATRFNFHHIASKTRKDIRRPR